VVSLTRVHLKVKGKVEISVLYAAKGLIL